MKKLLVLLSVVLLGATGAASIAAAFTGVVDPYLGAAKLYGFYLMDRPDPTGQWHPLCTPAHLKAEADYIYDKFGWCTITFIMVMNMSSTACRSGLRPSRVLHCDNLDELFQAGEIIRIPRVEAR